MARVFSSQRLVACGGREKAGIGLAYLSLATLVLLFTVFQGWYGGEMVYSHGAGVAEANKGTEAKSASRRWLEKLMKMFGDSSGSEKHDEKNKENEERK